MAFLHEEKEKSEKQGEEGGGGVAAGRSQYRRLREVKKKTGLHL